MSLHLEFGKNMKGNEAMVSLDDKRDEIQRIIDTTRGWLASFGEGSKAPRPQHEIEVKQRRLDVLKEVRDDYENAIERKRGAA